MEKASRLRQAKTYRPEQERQALLQFAHGLNGIDIAVGERGQAVLVGPDGTKVPIPANPSRCSKDFRPRTSSGGSMPVPP